MDIQTLHKRLCPEKVLGNFWRSADYKAASQVVADLGELPKETLVQAHKGSPSQVEVHPLVAIAFMRWADTDRFYRKLNSIIQ